jgi:uncharacterized ferredoxin-like protein
MKSSKNLLTPISGEKNIGITLWKEIMAGVHPREYLRKDRGEGVQTVKMLRSLPHCIGGVLGLACSDCGFESQSGQRSNQRLWHWY